MENDFKVADISLADFGRREISLAENEMPALELDGCSVNSEWFCMRKIGIYI